ncbi:MAG: PP2C family protein-serine/threonine phosphatase [Polyangiales bacterium]
MAAKTHVGHVRESNEDNHLIIPELGLIVVADGMGGHAGGEVASQLVIENVEREIRAIGAFSRAAPALALTAAIRAANDAVRQAGNERPALRGMGSTVVCALVIDRVAHVAHAGDSRAYRVRSGKIERLTRDHSLVEEYLRENPGAHEDDLDGVYRHLVTRAVGAAPSLEVDVNEYECEPGDVILFCSDGLTGPVEDDAIARLVARAPNIESAASALVQAALDGGGPDNVTVALAKIA